MKWETVRELIQYFEGNGVVLFAGDHIDI